MSPESTQFFKDQRILVTGACGTIGSELVRQLLEEITVGEVIGLDNNESELFSWSSASSATATPAFFWPMCATVRSSAARCRASTSSFTPPPSST